MFSYTDAQREKEGLKVYAISRKEYNSSTVFEEPLGFIEPIQVVRNNSVKYNNHLASLTEQKLPRIIVPVCPEGYYPVSYFMFGRIESYKKNIIHCLKDEFIDFHPLDQFPQNGTKTCMGLDAKFVFPLIREGYNDTKVAYSFDLCHHFYLSQFIFVDGVRRKTYGGGMPTFFNFQAIY